MGDRAKTLAGQTRITAKKAPGPLGEETEPIADGAVRGAVNRQIRLILGMDLVLGLNPTHHEPVKKIGFFPLHRAPLVHEAGKYQRRYTPPIPTKEYTFFCSDAREKRRNGRHEFLLLSEELPSVLSVDLRISETVAVMLAID